MRLQLAATWDGEYWPTGVIYLSPKLDGVRAVVRGGQVYSRTGKLIPSQQVQDLWGHPRFDGYDGELIAGDPTAPDAYRRTVSRVMSRDKGDDEMAFHVFDRVDSGLWSERMCSIPQELVEVPQTRVYSPDEAVSHMEILVDQGFEGAMLRDADTPYKHGRSTLREFSLVKVKKFHDMEATVIGVEPLLHNANDPTTNALGYTERSSHKENKIAQPMLGALVVEANGTQFKVGTGFTEAQRIAFWKEDLIGRIATIKYFPSGGKARPRFPVFLRWRQD